MAISREGRALVHGVDLREREVHDLGAASCAKKPLKLVPVILRPVSRRKWPHEPAHSGEEPHCFDSGEHLKERPAIDFHGWRKTCRSRPTLRASRIREIAPWNKNYLRKLRK